MPRLAFRRMLVLDINAEFSSHAEVLVKFFFQASSTATNHLSTQPPTPPTTLTTNEWPRGRTTKAIRADARRSILIAITAVLSFSATATASSAMKTNAAPTTVIHHAITATLDVKAGTISVDDTITLAAPYVAASGPLLSTLHGGLAPSSKDATVVVTSSDSAKESMMKGESRGTIPVDTVSITPSDGATSFTLSYAGKIQHAPEQSPHEHARSFSETAGTINDEGVYLAGSTRWIPRFGNELLTFSLTVNGLPNGFSVVSEGDEASTKGAAVFSSKKPVDDIHLIAGPFVRTSRVVEGVTIEAMLRSDDPALAERYLEVTGQYLAMYNGLIGPYPWSRFALVENFWETGYGMPGFTLLGPKIIRFPFILHSSYPHELLHNWWGNSVYLPLHGDNWCEGMTAYLADHLVEEQRGKGREYRQRAIAKFQDFVRDDNDFAVRSFSGRFSPASEAIGYGKWLMVLHMTRVAIGDDAFRRVIKDFYVTQQFKRTTFKDFENTVMKHALKPKALDGFFAAWLDGKGMPELRWSDVRSYRSPEEKWEITVELSQVQPGTTTYPMSVPFTVTTEDGRAIEGHVDMGRERTARTTMNLPAKPVRLDIDPRFDVFRRLHRDEIPPTLSLTLGEKRVLLVIPSDAALDEQSAWRDFANGVCAPDDKDACLVVTDAEVSTLPDDRAVWILGYGNNLRAAAVVGVKRFGARFDDYSLRLGELKQNNGDRSVALALRHPRNADKGLVFVGADNLDAISGLARKLPHYGKYSYLGFEGKEPTNVLKGAWPTESSPMTVMLQRGPAVAGRIKAGAPLAALPPPFNASRMVAMVQTLSTPAMDGRGYGSKGLDDATAVVVAAFKDASLRPGGKEGYLDCENDADGPGAKTVRACNIIGTIPGEDPSLPAVVVGAHLDHLGRGWPDARKGEQGKVHPGANDNASGVAALIEVARALSSQGARKRTITFAVFTGEEAGLRGSRRFVKDLGPAPEKKIMAMVNLDTVGRKDGAKKLLVLGGETAREWVHVFMGIGFVTGVETEMSSGGVMASDHLSFAEKGIPAVQIFSGASPDYHRPTDTADKIEPTTLVDVAVLTREATQYLADRDTPLTSTDAKAAGPTHGGERKVSLGTVPDFAFAGPGVRLTGVTPSSPADKAGLKAGDILIELHGKPVADLRSFAETLRSLKIGDKVTLKAKRGDETITREVVLDAR